MSNSIEISLSDEQFKQFLCAAYGHEWAEDQYSTSATPICARCGTTKSYTAGVYTIPFSDSPTSGCCDTGACVCGYINSMHYT